MKTLRRSFLLGVLLSWTSFVVSQESTPDSLPPEVELEELRMVVRTLAEENRKLKAQLAALQAARQPAAEAPLPSPPSQTPPAQPQTTAAGAQVLYVNPTWHYLLVDRGSSAGVQKNQALSVNRNGVLIAHGTVTEVKPEQSVAEIDLESLGSDGLYPKVGDRVQAR